MASRRIAELHDIPVLDKQGLIGLLRDVYFDPRGWTMRYLVVQTGAWLSQRPLLVPQAAIAKMNGPEGAIALSMTRDALRAGAHSADLDVHSARAMTGYRVEAMDGPVGRVEDIVADDERWVITGMVVDTRDLLPGARVLVPARAVAVVDFARRTMRLRLVREQVKRSPRLPWREAEEPPACRA